MSMGINQPPPPPPLSRSAPGGHPVGGVRPPSNSGPHDLSSYGLPGPSNHNASPSTSASNVNNSAAAASGTTIGSISLVTTNTEQFGHCPKARDGPALGCNYCWNTTDVNGRILRRKTKYHCPECQANLCIVPCFQAYHEALENENKNNPGSGGPASKMNRWSLTPFF